MFIQDPWAQLAAFLLLGQAAKKACPLLQNTSQTENTITHIKKAFALRVGVLGGGEPSAYNDQEFENVT